MPLNVTIAPDRANVGQPNQRPNLVNAGVELSCQDNPNGLGQVGCIDSAAFAQPALYTFGDTPRNYLRGPKYSQTDVSFMKNIRDRRPPASRCAPRSSTCSTRSTGSPRA